MLAGLSAVQTQGLLCDPNGCVSNFVTTEALAYYISTGLSLPDRLQQLFGPCLFSSAYQHALVPVINIGECRFSASFSLVFLAMSSLLHE